MSQIDLAFTNRLDKITKTYNDDITKSNHEAIIIERQMKISKREEQYITNRNLKNVDWTMLNAKILSHDSYIKLLTDKDVDSSAEGTVKLIKEILNEVAPVKKHKVNNIKNLKHNNEQTKKLIGERDNSYKLMKLSPNVDNVRDFRIKQNIVRKHIRKATKEALKKEFNDVKDNPRRQRFSHTNL